MQFARSEHSVRETTRFRASLHRGRVHWLASQATCLEGVNDRHVRGMNTTWHAMINKNL